MKSYIDFSVKKNHASINDSSVRMCQPEAALNGLAVSNELKDKKTCVHHRLSFFPPLPQPITFDFMDF